MRSRRAIGVGSGLLLLLAAAAAACGTAFTTEGAVADAGPVDASTRDAADAAPIDGAVADDAAASDGASGDDSAAPDDGGLQDGGYRDDLLVPAAAATNLTFGGGKLFWLTANGADVMAATISSGDAGTSARLLVDDAGTVSDLHADNGLLYILSKFAVSSLLPDGTGASVITSVPLDVTQFVVDSTDVHYLQNAGLIPAGLYRASLTDGGSGMVTSATSPTLLREASMGAFFYFAGTNPTTLTGVTSFADGGLDEVPLSVCAGAMLLAVTTNALACVQPATPGVISFYTFGGRLNASLAATFSGDYGNPTMLFFAGSTLYWSDARGINASSITPTVTTLITPRRATSMAANSAGTVLFYSEADTGDLRRVTVN